MGGAREIGIGIARALSLEGGPNPLPLSFKGEPVTEAAAIVASILRECDDAGIRLEEVRLDAELFDEVRGQNGTGFRLTKDTSLSCEVLFFRG